MNTYTIETPTGKNTIKAERFELSKGDGVKLFIGADLVAHFPEYCAFVKEVEAPKDHNRVHKMG